MVDNRGAVVYNRQKVANGTSEDEEQQCMENAQRAVGWCETVVVHR